MQNSWSITKYSAKDATKEIWYIPKINTDLFKDGNGIPLLRRKIHEYKQNDQFKSIGCDNSIEHACPFCERTSEMYCKLEDHIKRQSKIGEEYRDEDWVRDRFREGCMDLPVRSSEKVYMVVALVHHVPDSLNVEHEIKLMRMSIERYNNVFRKLLLTENTTFGITYPNTGLMIDKIKQLEIEPVRIDYAQEQLETEALSSIRDIHGFDLEQIYPELCTTNHERANRLFDLVMGKWEKELIDKIV